MTLQDRFEMMELKHKRADQTVITGKIQVHHAKLK